MTIPDWLPSLASIIVGAGIYWLGHRNGVAMVRADPVIKNLLRAYAEAEAEARARETTVQGAPTTKRELPAEQPATTWEEDAS